MAADALDSFLANLLAELSDFFTYAAALRLPLYVTAALGALLQPAEVLASRSDMLSEAVRTQLAAAAAHSLQEVARAREALARAPAPSAW